MSIWWQAFLVGVGSVMIPSAIVLAWMILIAPSEEDDYDNPYRKG